MAHQIIRQPDGKYAVWSAVVDAFVLIDAEPSDIVNFWVADYREQTERRVAETVAQLAEGKQPYYQFTMSWDDALKMYAEVHGAEFDLEQERKTGV